MLEQHRDQPLVLRKCRMLRYMALCQSISEGQKQCRLHANDQLTQFRFANMFHMPVDQRILKISHQKLWNAFIMETMCQQGGNVLQRPKVDMRCSKL